MVELLPGTGVLLNLDQYTRVELAARRSWEGGFRALIRASFPNAVLAASSATGKRSVFPALDPRKLGVLKGK